MKLQALSNALHVTQQKYDGLVHLISGKNRSLSDDLENRRENLQGLARDLSDDNQSISIENKQ
jgi:hypothetical protein